MTVSYSFSFFQLYHSFILSDLFIVLHCCYGQFSPFFVLLTSKFRCNFFCNIFMSHCLSFISFLLCAILNMVFLQLFYLMFLGFVAFDSIVLLRRILNILVLSSLRIFSKSIHFFIPVIALEMLNMLIPAMYTVFSWFAAIIQQ